MKMFRLQPYTEGYDCFQFEFYGCPEGEIINALDLFKLIDGFLAKFNLLGLKIVIVNNIF